MVEGRLTGIVEGAITGWVQAEADGDPAWLEAAADGDAPFGPIRVEAGEAGRARFAIPIPEAYLDGRMRFFDVRLRGDARPLEGGPVAFDGGLFASLGLAPAAPPPGPAAAPPLIEGAVRFEPPQTVEGWAMAPDQPGRRLRIEIMAGDRLVAAVTAERPHPDAGGDGRHGFRVDLSKLLRHGPHEITFRVEGAVGPLPGGRFRTGVFAADGEVDCPGYLDSPEDRALVARLPFEHQARAALHMDPARLAPRLINRLRRERIASGPPRFTPSVALLALPGVGEATRAAWALQSHPATAVIEAAAGPDGIRAGVSKAAFVLFAGPGDLLHPSSARIAVLARDPDVISWPRFCADAARAGSPGTLLRRPPFDPVTASHGAGSDTTLALRGEVLAKAPDKVLAALAEGRMHPLWVWLAGRKLTHHSHPEALTSRVGDWSPPSRAEQMRDEALILELLAERAADFTLAETTEDLPAPAVLVPTARARKTSVVIPFRGKVELTLRCIHALAGQRLSGELELVLVDNQSEPQDAERIISGARRMLGAERVVALSWDAAFNHSAQNNLGVAASEGEVVVICNNDVAFKDPALLEQLGAWALRPGVATVGCRLEDPVRGVGSHGHIHPEPSGDAFRALLRENPDPGYGRYVHAVPGNTLALAAIRRELFLELGGLDAVRFPIGYNDVDFMLRASSRGLIHLYLGHLLAEHPRGSSRTGDDEDLQALQLSQAYPAAPGGRLAQLSRVRIGEKTGESPKAAVPSAEDVALIERLEGLLARQAQIEQARAGRRPNPSGDMGY